MGLYHGQARFYGFSINFDIYTIVVDRSRQMAINRILVKHGEFGLTHHVLMIIRQTRQWLLLSLWPSSDTRSFSTYSRQSKSKTQFRILLQIYRCSSLFSLIEALDWELIEWCCYRFVIHVDDRRICIDAVDSGDLLFMRKIEPHWYILQFVAQQYEKMNIKRMHINIKRCSIWFQFHFSLTSHSCIFF
jgi:hypothetical protein